MKTKLTLSIDKELVQFAHRQAHSSGKSVSDIFSDFLLVKKAESASKVVPEISVMTGSLKEYAVDDSKATIRKSYAKKYSR